MRRILVGLIAASAVAAGGGCERAANQPQSNARTAGKAVPAAAASPADDGNWTMPGKDYASTRFSGLTELTPANVAGLQVAMTFSTGTTDGFEAPPLVVDNVMYVVTPWPNNVFALDLTKPGAPAKWVYKPEPAAAAKGVACCGPVNRGAFYSNGRLFMNLLDGHTVAI